MSERKEKPKVIKRADKQNHPLYDAFCYQMSATVKLARAIKADAKTKTPSYVDRFLDEFGQKAT